MGRRYRDLYWIKPSRAARLKATGQERLPKQGTQLLSLRLDKGTILGSCKCFGWVGNIVAWLEDAPASNGIVQVLLIKLVGV